MNLELEVLGEEAINDAIALARSVLSNRATLRGSVTNKDRTGLLDRIRDRFIRQVDPDGVPWVPSLAAMIEGRATLYHLGTLYRGLDVVYEGDYEWAIGANKDGKSPYWAVHNFGYSPTKTIRRRFLGYNPTDVELIVEYLNGRIADALRQK